MEHARRFLRNAVAREYKLKSLIEPKMEHVDIAFRGDSFLCDAEDFACNELSGDEERPVSPTEASIAGSALADADARIVCALERAEPD